MNKPKYEIGDRLGTTNLIVRGVVTSLLAEAQELLLQARFSGCV